MLSMIIIDHELPVPQLLANYADLWLKRPNLYFGHSLEKEKEKHAEFIKFYQPLPELFCRSHLAGHFTGSALITNRSFDRVLLTLHRKLQKWLQLGGHADGDTNLARVALREAQEESGLKSFEFVDLAKIFKCGPSLLIPYDLDCHYIPERSDIAAHYHYDVIFLLATDQDRPLEISTESIDLRWFELETAFKLTEEEALLRLFRKLQAIKAHDLR